MGRMSKNTKQESVWKILEIVGQPLKHNARVYGTKPHHYIIQMCLYNYNYSRLLYSYSFRHNKGDHYGHATTNLQ